MSSKNHNHKDDRSYLNLVKALIPLTAGIAAYKIARSPFYSKIPELAKAQEASGGKLTYVMDEWDAYPNLYPTKLIDKIKNRLFYSPVKFVKAQDLVPGQKLEGAVYHYVSSPDFKGAIPRADVEYNTDLEFLNKYFSDKLNYNKLKSEYIAKGGPAREILEEALGRPIKTKRDFNEAVKKLEKDLYFKPRVGYAQTVESGHFNTEMLKANKRDATPFYKNLDNYIYNEKIPYEKLKDGFPAKEQRVHFAIINGVPTVFGSKYYKFSPSIGQAKDFSNEVLEQAMAEVIKNNPQLRTKSNFILGADVIPNAVTGKPMFVELNDMSGYLEVPREVRKLYKHLTGRYDPLTASGIALGTAGLTGGGVALLDAIRKNKGNQENQEKIWTREEIRR